MPAQKLFEQDLTTLAVLVSLGNKSFGSGLFMVDHDEIFFATARHVLFTEKIDKEKLKKALIKTCGMEERMAEDLTK